MVEESPSADFIERLNAATVRALEQSDSIRPEQAGAIPRPLEPTFHYILWDRGSDGGAVGIHEFARRLTPDMFNREIQDLVSRATINGMSHCWFNPFRMAPDRRVWEGTLCCADARPGYTGMVYHISVAIGEREMQMAAPTMFRRMVYDTLANAWDSLIYYINNREHPQTP